MVNGVLENAGVYTQPTGQPARDATFDVTAAHATDSVLSFTASTWRATSTTACAAAARRRRPGGPAT